MRWLWMAQLFWTNYNSLANKTYTETADIGLVAENANSGTDLSSRLSTVSAPWKDGRWTFNSTTMSFGKLTSLVPDGPYSALQLGLTVRSERDSRNFISTALNMNATTTTDCIAAGNCNSVQTGSPLDRSLRAICFIKCRWSRRSKPADHLAKPVLERY